ncbi:hypothetical protein PENSPDRAFT_658505 [Peniophora sp. CONT]|nr:hypothetical protein PENSPDRAFT_658505 [Peniophora sp. CONT]
MFALLPRILLGVILVVQLSPTIAAPAPLNTLRGLEVRAKDKSKISLFKNALPEDGTASPFIILDAPASTVTAQVGRSRSLQTVDSPGLPLQFEPLDDGVEDEHFGRVGTSDIDPLEATALKVKRCLGDGSDIGRLGGVLEAKRHLPGGDSDCGEIGADDEPIDGTIPLVFKRHLEGQGGKGPDFSPGQKSRGGQDSDNGDRQKAAAAVGLIGGPRLGV